MPTNVTRLKELLFDTEQARLGELTRRLELLAVAEQQQREGLTYKLKVATEQLQREHADLVAKIEGLNKRAGSDEQFQTTVAGVLDGAVRDAEKTHHMALTRAMAPMVLRTIRTEFERTESEILQALMPHTGRLVRDYVATAMRDLVAQINQRLEAGLKQNPAMLRIRSIVTGRSVGELALAEIAKPQVTDLFLIRRGSGELIARWPTGPEFDSNDVHLSGILSHINDFALTAFKDGDGGEAIQTFEFRKSTVYLRASPITLLAARVTGPQLPGSQGIVDDAFYSIEAHEQPRAGTGGAAPATGEGAVPPEATPQALDGLATTLDQRLSAKHAELAVPSGLGFNPLLALAIMIALPVCGWLAWSFYVDYATYRARTAVARVIAASNDLKIYKPDVEIGPMGQSVRITALAPSEEARQTLITRLHVELPGTEIADDMTVLPGPGPDFEPRLKDVQRGVSLLETQLRLQLTQDAVDRAASRGETRISSVLSDLTTIPAATAAPRRMAAVTAGRGDAGKALDDVRWVKGVAYSSTVPPDSVRGRLHAASESLRRATAQLTAALLDEPVSPPAATPMPADAVAAAEALSSAAERLSAVTLMTVQTLKTPPPAPIIPQPSPRDRLDAWTRANAVFFSANADYRESADVQRRLKDLARLMAASGDLVRVVGYTDEKGQARNSTVSKERADRVYADLIALGVPANRLVAVGRPTGVDISPAVGQSSPNRRVEFEIGFIGEGSGGTSGPPP